MSTSTSATPKSRKTKTGQTVAENAKDWQKLRNQGWSPEKIAKSAKYKPFNYKVEYIKSLTNAPTVVLPRKEVGRIPSDVDLEAGMSGTEEENADCSDDAPVYLSSGDVLGALQELDTWVQDNSDTAEGIFAVSGDDAAALHGTCYVTLTAAGTVLNSHIGSMTNELYSRVGNGIIQADDGSKHELYRSRPVEEINTGPVRQQLDTVFASRYPNPTAADAMEFAAEMYSPNWRVGALYDNGYKVREAGFAERVEGMPTVQPETATLGEVCRFLDDDAGAFEYHRTARQRRYVDLGDQELLHLLIDTQNVRKRCTESAGEHARHIAEIGGRSGEAQVGGEVHDLDGNLIGKIVSGNRYVKWDHDKVRDAIVDRHTPDNTAAGSSSAAWRDAMNAFEELANPKFKKRALSKLGIDLNQYTHTRDGKPKLRAATSD